MILFMAMDDKTEKPTPKKRRDTREKGEVLKSQELSSAVVLLSLVTIIKTFSSYIGLKVSSVFLELRMDTNLESANFDKDFVHNYLIKGLVFILLCIFPILVAAVLTGLLVNYMQIGFLLTTKALRPRFDRLNPINGLKRVFSMRALVELLKSIIKITILGLVLYSTISKKADEIPTLVTYDLGTSLDFIVDLALEVGMRCGLFLLVIGVLDYFYQWWMFERNLMMTKQEVKEEFKQLEGNPQTKSRIREKQREIGMRRMMHAVPEADVVVVNPTHYAVALKYDPEKHQSPIVLAKGKGYVALRIREVAKENNVEIVENKEVARALYDTTEIGQQIPESLYRAVAEILAYVYRMKNYRGGY